MNYAFSKFILNSDKKELFVQGKRLALTQQHFDLLLLLVQNANEVVSKEELIRTVWQGKVVENNSINRSVSKLRSIRSTAKQDRYVESVYGQGVRFLPKVRIQKQRRSGIATAVLVSLALLACIVWLYIKSEPNHLPIQVKVAAPFVILPGTIATDENNWLSVSPGLFVEQLLSYSSTVSLKKYRSTDRTLSLKEYLDEQWKRSPTLKTVTTEITQDQGVFTLSFILSSSSEEVERRSFSHQDLSIAFRLGCNWLYQILNVSYKDSDIEFLIPSNSFLLELYLRGIASLSSGEMADAVEYFELALHEQADFHIARLGLAKSKYRQGKQKESLALLNALTLLDPFPALEIEIGALRGKILGKQGRQPQARDLYLDLIAKFSAANIPSLDQVHYNLSYTYAAMTEYELALEQLTWLEEHASQGDNSDIMPDVLHKKGSILQKIGRTQEAKINASRSVALFLDRNDLLGAAKVHSLLGRIAAHQADYQEAELQLDQSMKIAKSMDYKLGIGATLNELAYVALLQGKITKAWEFNREMESIALDINHTSMQLASKKLAVDISRGQRRWKAASLYLDQHESLAEKLDNRRALINNKALALSLMLDQAQTEKASELIQQLQEHIDTSLEVRLQSWLDKESARFYLVNNQDQIGIPLLLSARALAWETSDGNSVIEINNILGKHYIENNNPRDALIALDQSTSLAPTAYPYLLLRSKAAALQSKHRLALEQARQCKAAAIELWSLEDLDFPPLTEDSMPLAVFRLPP